MSDKLKPCATISELGAMTLEQVEQYDIALASVGGCSDGYCKMTGPSKGMHTNGGCQCHDDRFRARIAMGQGRKLRDCMEALGKDLSSRAQPEAVTNAGDVVPLDEVSTNIIGEVGGVKSPLNIVWLQQRLEQLLAERAATAEADLAKAREVIQVHQNLFKKLRKAFHDRHVVYVDETDLADAKEAIAEGVQSCRNYLEGK